jgi:hypothetical protein
MLAPEGDVTGAHELGNHPVDPRRGNAVVEQAERAGLRVPREVVVVAPGDEPLDPIEALAELLEPLVPGVRLDGLPGVEDLGPAVAGRRL